MLCAGLAGSGDERDDSDVSKGTGEDGTSRRHGADGLATAVELGKRLKRLQPEWERWRVWLEAGYLNPSTLVINTSTTANDIEPGEQLLGDFLDAVRCTLREHGFCTPYWQRNNSATHTEACDRLLSRHAASSTTWTCVLVRRESCVACGLDLLH